MHDYKHGLAVCDKLGDGVIRVSVTYAAKMNMHVVVHDDMQLGSSKEGLRYSLAIGYLKAFARDVAGDQPTIHANIGRILKDELSKTYIGDDIAPATADARDGLVQGPTGIGVACHPRLLHDAFHEFVW